MVAQIFLIRHGATAWSATGRHTSHTDLPLSEDGQRHAANLREALRGIKFTEVLTSPLQRARQTCELAGLGPLARIDADLHEWDYGAYEGRTSADIRAQRSDWNLFRDGCPEGESTGQISRRADQVLATIRPNDGIVALFSHGHFLRVLATRWIGLPVLEGQHFALETASVSILGYEHPHGEIPTINQWNVVAQVSSPGSPRLL